MLTKQGIITARLSQITRKLKQDNGKENVIIRFNLNNGNENVYTHIFRGYIFPKDKRSMISMTGYNIGNHLGKGRRMTFPKQRCLNN